MLHSTEGQNLSFTFVGDEHPHPLRSETDLNSRGAAHILGKDLIKAGTCLVLEFLHEENQKIIDGFLAEPKGEDNFLKQLPQILLGRNLLRGYKDCKNISFFALIQKAKEVGAKVLCGDSTKALNTKDKLGAITKSRHPAMNQHMSGRITDFIDKHSEIKDFVILCGDSHLFGIGFQDGINSPSLPTLVKAKYPDATFKVVAQQYQSLKEFNDEFAQKEGIEKFSQENFGEDCYTYLPWKERITDFGYNSVEVLFDKLSYAFPSNEISQDRNRSGSNSGSDDGMRKRKDFFIPDKDGELKLKEEFSLSQDEELPLEKLQSLLGAIVLRVSNKEELTACNDMMYQLLQQAVEGRSKEIERIQSFHMEEGSTAKKPLLD